MKKNSLASLYNDYRPESIEAFNSTFRHLNNLLYIDNPNFKCMVTLCYQPKLQLNMAYPSDMEQLFLKFAFISLEWIF